ncbi:hypothetical protein Pst134EA_026695 [Puccinia striiformis f. sp. tritici]|uniref:hypothetical protein n=1 Tax=Puccinia striiformis f. sp. tritici TaxID=168172 RepID=UPI002007F69F|nr:hypothetical protein Pst134EA_026695 [Puccinia striiformis f. sp. tritici]KAH9449983.1 hypothetical protein Pst134EA_026695 [Puccinia striiformis f. sp. tritici]
MVGLFACTLVISRSRNESSRMAPGSSLKFLTPTTSKVWFSVIILLTGVINERILCALQPDPVPTWLAWYKLMRDSAFESDLHDFATSPWPDSPLILPHSNKHDRQIDDEQHGSNRIKFEEIERPTVRKKMKKSRDNCGYDSLPFEIFDCHRPSGTEEQVIFEAIRSLKQVDRSRFIKEGEGEYKMLKIPENRIKDFLALVVNRGQNPSGIPRIGESSSSDLTSKQFSIERQSRKRKALARFHSEATRLDLRPLYTDRVIPDFYQSIEEIRAHIRNTESLSSDRKHLLYYFNRVLTLMPLYLFHVDMINTVIPDVGFKGKDNTLRYQRQTAGKHFLEYIKQLVHEYDQSLTKGRSTDDQTLGEGCPTVQYFFKTSNHSSFCWNIILYWVQLSRKTLASSIITDGKKSQKTIMFTFKQLFNEFITSYIEQFFNYSKVKKSQSLFSKHRKI